MLGAVVVSPSAYGDVLDAVAAGGFTLAQRKGLAAEAFAHTASYDVAVANWFAATYVGAEDGWPAVTGETWDKATVLRYGENPHQSAALYVDGTGGLADAEQLHGKEMSYNNYVDTDAARSAAYGFDEPAVAIIKHANPCGIAVGADVAEAHRRDEPPAIRREVDLVLGLRWGLHHEPRHDHLELPRGLRPGLHTRPRDDRRGHHQPGRGQAGRQRQAEHRVAR